MKKYSLLFLLALICNGILAQNFAWAKVIGGITVQQGGPNAVDDSGNVFTAGVFDGTVDFDPGPGVYNLTSVNLNNAYILKLDASGNFKWARSIVGKGQVYPNGIALDATGNVCVGGWYADSADLDPGVGTYNVWSRTSSDPEIFVLKLDPSGNFMWGKRLGGVHTDAVDEVTFDPAGNVYITGSFQDTVDFDPGPGIHYLISGAVQVQNAFILKLDASGNFVWATSIVDTSVSLSHYIITDQNGNSYTTGVFLGTADFDPGNGVYNLTAIGPGDIFILKLDPAGNFVFAKRFGDVYTNGDVGFTIAVDESGNIYTAGQFAGTVDFDPGPGVYNLTSASAGDGFILKLDSSCNFIWAKGLWGTSPFNDAVASIMLDDSGNVYAMGMFADSCDFDPGSGTYYLKAHGKYDYDTYLLKLNNSGNFIWAMSYGGTGEDRGISIAIDTSGSLYASGSFQYTVDLDPGPGTQYYTTNGVKFDAYIIKLCTPPSSASPISGVTSVCPGATATYSINTVPRAIGYMWTVSPGITIDSGQNTISIKVTFGSTPGKIKVTPYNSCSDGGSDSLIVSIPPLLKVGFTSFPLTSATTCINDSIHFYTTGDTSFIDYRWYFYSLEQNTLDSTDTKNPVIWLKSGRTIVKLRAEYRDKLCNTYSWFTDTVYGNHKPIVNVDPDSISSSCREHRVRIKYVALYSDSIKVNWGDSSSVVWQKADSAGYFVHTYFDSSHVYSIIFLVKNSLCTGSDTLVDSVNLLIMDSLKLKLNFTDSTICKGASLTMKTSGSGGNGHYNFMLFSSSLQLIALNNTGSFTVTPDSNQTFKIVIEDDCNSKRDSVFIRIKVYSSTINDTVSILYTTVVDSFTTYTIWNKLSGAVSYSIRNNTITDTFFVHHNALASEQSEKYYVRANDICGNKSVLSEVAQTIYLKGENQNFNEFALLEYTPYETWKQGVMEYEVQYFNKASSSWQKLNTEPGNTLTSKSKVLPDSNNFNSATSQICYRVIAKEQNGNKQFSTSNVACVPVYPVVFLPNAFSPNGDGLNDYFKPICAGLNNYIFEIYNRWGEMVYTDSPESKGWDGMFRGEKAEAGAYVYRLSAIGLLRSPSTNDARVVERKGTLYLVR